MREKLERLSKEDKIKLIEKCGWERSWSEDNWVRSNARNKEANTGIPTESVMRIIRENQEGYGIFFDQKGDSYSVRYKVNFENLYRKQIE